MKFLIAPVMLFCLLTSTAVRAEDEVGEQAQSETAVSAGEADKKSPEAQGGAGDLMITTTRVVLDDKKRFSDILLINRGSKEETYRISLQHMRMLDSGDYQAIDAKNPLRVDEKLADDLIRYSPRQVTLKPGEMQSVKFTVKNLGTAQPGEYRSHVLFQGNPDETKGQDIEKFTSDNQKITVKLVPIYGLSIPLVVRHGDLQASAQLVGGKVEKKLINVTIERQGTKSLYGDLTVTKNDAVVGQIKGIAVFVPNNRRQVQIPLADGENLSGDDLTITYREREEDGGAILAATKVRG